LAAQHSVTMAFLVKNVERKVICGFFSNRKNKNPRKLRGEMGELRGFCLFVWLVKLLCIKCRVSLIW